MTRYLLTAALAACCPVMAVADDANPPKFEPTEVFKIRGHTSTVTCVRYSPDGKLIATASRDKTVRIWDARTGERKARIANQEEAYCVAFSPDAKRIAIGSYGGAVNVFGVADGEKTQTVRTPESVAMVAWSPAGDVLAVAAVGDGDVSLYALATGKATRTLKGKERGVRAITFSPDGSSLVTANDDSTIRRFSTATGKEVDSLKCHDGAVMSVAYSRDGKQLVTGGADGTIVRWDVVTGNVVKPVMELAGGDDRGLMGVGVLPSGRVWGRTTGGANAVFAPATGRTLAANPAPKRLLVFYGETYFSNLCALSPDGTTFAVANGDDASVWDASRDFGTDRPEADRKRD
jgi:WD40 repeat protein